MTFARFGPALFALFLAVIMLAQGLAFLWRPKETIRWHRGLPPLLRFFLRFDPFKVTLGEAESIGTVCMFFAGFAAMVALVAAAFASVSLALHWGQ